MRQKTYTEMLRYDSFADRFEYLKLDGQLGSITFGQERYLNQALYKSLEWQVTRNIVIVRDNGCDLGVEGCEINGKVLIHHINPITIEMINNRDSYIFDPENLITVSMKTHNAIHYANDEILDAYKIVERKPNDTIPWR